WVNVEFKLIPLQKVNGICRFHLSKVHPYLELYVTPVNIDPSKPILPISTPAEYSSDLAAELGYFFTLGMPEDTKALDHGSLDEDSFLEQADSILEERLKMLNLELKKFNSGVLFVYFSTTDPVQHMFWRYIDEKHPLYNAGEASRYSDVIRQTYIKMDAILGDVMKKIDGKTTVIVLSDHGFGSFRRYFHLNTWLKENGYLFLRDKNRDESGEFFENVDFQKTRAYALGFNALYINLKGREGEGIVPPAEKEKVVKELITKLEQIKDPETGLTAINKMYRREEIYSGKYLEESPDLLVGYNAGYCASWETSLGKVPKGLFGDNKMKWSGNHLWDYKLVPGIILSNRKIKKDNPALYDVAPSILTEFGIKPDEEMVGKQIF
ncbi:MAG: alkaline phosphatase family protein, partial [Nitrospirae bacterium]|nr:alkaline phosphatase family protein [Nitrospirota bacterium]